MGLVLYPDDYDKDPVTGTVTDLPDGVVFLPAAGYRNGSNVTNVGDNGRFLRSRTRRHLDRRWTEALCTESDPYVLLSVRNAREGFLKHFDGDEKEII